MVTIVIHSYRYGHLASHCLETVLSQTLEPTKILFIDDGVGDCKYIPEMYPQVEFIQRKSTLGQVDSFNNALNMISTKYFMMIGADNWLRCDALEVLLTREADIISYDLVVTGSEKKRWSTNTKDACNLYEGGYYWSRKGLHHGSMIMNTIKAKQCGYGSYISKDNKICEDYYLYTKMLETGSSYNHVSEGLLYYRKHRFNFNGI